MKAIYEEIYKVHTYDVDLNDNLKISSIFKYMQDIAASHALELNTSYYDLVDKDLMWVISRAKLEILKYPTFGDKLKIRTWVKGIDKAFVLRDFIIYDINDNVVAKATTCWLLITISSKRPQRPKIVMDKMPIVSDEYALFNIPSKILESSTADLVYNYLISYSNIDINQHVNNTNYIDILLNSFEEEMFSKHTIVTFQINFLSECTYGNSLSISKGKYIDKPNSFYLEAYNENKKNKVVQAIIDWK